MDEDNRGEPEAFEKLRQRWERGNGNGVDRRPRLIRLKGEAALVPQPMGTVVRGICHRGSLTLFYGPPKSGKSFLATDLSLSIAAGEPDWMGHKIRRPGAVLYAACEGHAGFWKRLVAAKQKRGLAYPRGDSFQLLLGRPYLITLEDHGRTAVPNPGQILDEIDAMTEEGTAPVVVVIDTMFRAMGTGNVNDSTHANAFLAAVGMIMDRGIAVIVIHHEIKSGGTPAGSVSLIGGADTIIRTQNLDDADHAWEVEFAKDDATTEARKFKLEIIPIGADSDGDEATSCVVIPIAGKTPRRTSKLTPAHEEFREILMEAMIESGSLISPEPDMPPVKTITREALRTALIRKGWFSEAQLDGTIKLTRRDHKDVQNALRALKDRGICAFNGSHVWLTP